MSFSFANAHLNSKSFQVATLEQMLSTGRQSASDENETDPESRQFHNWKGNKGAAEILLPDVEEEDSSSESSSGSDWSTCSDSDSDPGLLPDVEEEN